MVSKNVNMKKLIRIFVFFSCWLQATSWRFKKYPYADLSLTGKIKFDGYPLEIYKITTEDQYVLSLYRIPYGRNSTNMTNRSPVLLVHGMFASAETLLVPGRYKALPYYLADSGFDVWLMNSRGCPGSQKHLKYNINRDKDYWNFDFQDIAIYDLSAKIDFILKKTKKQLFVIGHSQGTTTLYILFSEKPEYNDKVKMSVSYAPSIVLHHINFPVVKIFVYLSDIIEEIWKILGFVEALPMLHVIWSATIKPICREQTYFFQLCYLVVSAIGTHESHIFNKELVPVMVSVPLARISSKQVFHYLQISKSGIFRKFDFGTIQNIKEYNQTTPPLYNLNYSTVPNVLFYAEQDEYNTAEGIKEVINMLPNIVQQEKIKYKYFTHTDFLFGNNASTLVYKPTIEIFRNFDNQNNSKIKKIF